MVMAMLKAQGQVKLRFVSLGQNILDYHLLIKRMNQLVLKFQFQILLLKMKKQLGTKQHYIYP
jgi:hypothetical protein